MGKDTGGGVGFSVGGIRMGGVGESGGGENGDNCS